MQKNRSNVKEILLNHINNNIKQYIVVILLFIIGIIIGMLLIENASDEIKTEISSYMSSFTQNLKENSNVNKNKLFLTSVKNNLKTTLLMWFMGSTIIGIPIVFGMIVFKGICIGYTVSSLLGVFGTGKGIMLTFFSIFLHNIICIPAILALGVSGINLYKVITKNRHRENVKMEILRHTIFSGIIFVFILLSSFIESYVSSTLTEWYVNLI